MTELIFGPAGSGKTSLLFERIRADVDAGVQSYLIVPEQNTVSREEQAAAILPPSAPLSFEVTNFTRLADTVFRRLGGITCRYADAGTEVLLLWETLQSLSASLHDKRPIDTARVNDTRTALRELCAAGATTEKIAAAAASVKGDPSLAVKLGDYSAILSSYRRRLQASGSDLSGEELRRLATLLRERHPITGAHIYCDDFTSYTADQLEILSELARDNDLTVTVGMPLSGAENDLAYGEWRDTKERLCRRLRAYKIRPKMTELTGNRRMRSGFAAAIAAGLFAVRPAELPASVAGDDGVRLVACPNPFEEADFVAGDIAERVMKGASYRDFLVVAGNAADYRGILDAALEAHGIPAFFSVPVDLSAFELVKMIRTAYAVLCGGFRRMDFITYLKCGFSGLTQDEADYLELYLEDWQISGRRLAEGPFRMYPCGYSIPREGKEIEAQKAELAELNRLREKAVAPLLILNESCKEKITIRKHCETLYRFLSVAGVEKRLYEYAQIAERHGHPDKAAVEARLFETVCQTLDLLCDLTPDVTLYAQDFSELLTLQFSSGSLRTIPPSADAVTVGSADDLRPSTPRFVYMIGVNAGVFPTLPHGNAAFTAEECERLSNAGILLESNDAVYASRSLFSFLRAFSAASEVVTVSYPLTNGLLHPIAKADVIDRLLLLAGNRLRVEDYASFPTEKRVFSVEKALREAARGGTDAPVLRRAISGVDEGAAARLDAAARPLVQLNEQLRPETMQAVFSGRVPMSQSKLEDYMNCPFAYYCKHTLRLTPHKRLAFSSREIGDYIHAVMQAFFAGGMPEKTDDAAAAERVRAATISYLQALFPDGEKVPARIAHTIARLEKNAVALAVNVCAELQSSGFRPQFVEYGLGDGDRSHAAPLQVEVPDACKAANADEKTVAVFRGRIDRVDVLEKAATDGRQVYVRVIDYKTGEIEFNLGEVRKGRNLQMILYLMALRDCKDAAYLRSLGADAGTGVTAAGVQYVRAEQKAISLKTPHEKAAVDVAVERSGIRLDDADDETGSAPLDAPSDDLSGTPSGSPSNPPADAPADTSSTAAAKPRSEKGDVLMKAEEMDALFADVKDLLGQILGEIKGGQASATPASSGEKHCDYCDFKAVCRSSGAPTPKQ